MNLQNDILKLIQAKKIEAAKILIDKNISSKSLYYYLHGLCYCSEEKFKNAVLYFKLSNIYGFNHYLLYYNLGVAFLEINNYNSSLASFEKSLLLNRNFIKSYINIAFIYYKKNDVKSAYRYIKTGLANNDCSELKCIEKKLFSLLK